jgi:chemotaxis protein CheD
MTRAPEEPSITVTMGDMRVARPPAVLRAIGIGSCVAVVIRDVRSGAGGMAHIMLPFLPKRVREGTNLLKYADQAIERMVEALRENGGEEAELEARIVGGAHMFGGKTGANPLDIGRRNLEAVRKKLRQLAIPIVAEDTGGAYGRSVQLSLGDGRLRVSSVRQGSRTL